MANPLQYVIDAVSLGGLYALVALGIGLIFGIMRLINFAYGDYIAWGAYALVVPASEQVATKFIGNWPAPLLVAAVVAIVMGLALVTERAAFRPLRRADAPTLLITSFAVSYLLQSIVLVVHSGRPKSVNIGASLTDNISLGALRVPLIDLVTIGACLLLLAALALFLKRTSYGVQMRAAAENFRMARYLGVRANGVIAGAFAISGLLAAVVSLLVVVKTGVLNYRMGVSLTLVGFVATVVGGLGSISGAVVGGFTIGFVSMILQAILPESLRAARDAFVFGLIIVILVARPQGLVPARSARERV